MTPGYFAGLSIRRLAGREFQVSDDATHPGVAIVDAEFARRFFAGHAVGAVLETSVGKWAWGKETQGRFEVVGVVSNVRPLLSVSASQPTLYLSLLQIPQRQMKLLLRGAGIPALTVIREHVRKIDPDVPIVAATDLAVQRRREIAQPRFSFELVGGFGFLALALSGIGVYGILVAWVEARRKEIGVRVALGAGRKEVLQLVAGQGGRMALKGVLAGLALAWLGAHVLSSQLYGISAADPVAWASAPVIVLASVVAASIGPACRAARVLPAESLKSE